MKINLSEIISWQICIILLLLLIFFLWLGYGGQENLEYVGLAPLKPGIKTSEYLGYKSKEKIDNTPVLPDFENINKNKEINFVNSYEAEKVETFQVFDNKDDLCFSKSFVSNEYELNESNETDESFVSNEYELNESNETDESFVSNEYELNESNETNESLNNIESPKSPKSLALGEHTCYKNGKISKGEMFCKRAIEEIYKVPFYCVRPNFLKNPETGRNLELDMYNDSLKIAVEYNAAQHYIFPNSFHKTYEEFINQVRRDQFKVETCDQNGIYLITVPYNVPLEYESIKKYIEYHLPKN